jgi:hypothetical protein
VSCGFTELAEFYVVHLAQLRSKFVDVENCLDSGNHLDGFYQSAVMAQDEIDSAKYNPVENGDVDAFVLISDVLGCALGQVSSGG